jgi:hypothetical protein
MRTDDAMQGRSISSGEKRLDREATSESGALVGKPLRTWSRAGIQDWRGFPECTWHPQFHPISSPGSMRVSDRKDHLDRTFCFDLGAALRPAERHRRPTSTKQAWCAVVFFFHTCFLLWNSTTLRLLLCMRMVHYLIKDPTSQSQMCKWRALTTRRHGMAWAANHSHLICCQSHAGEPWERNIHSSPSRRLCWNTALPV